MKLLLPVLLLTLSGCASLGAEPQMFDCDQLNAFTKDYDGLPILKQIQQGADDQPGAGQTGSATDSGTMRNRDIDQNDPLLLSLTKDQPNDRNGPLTSEPKKILLLSGGSFWGAFGAGALNQMAQDNPKLRFDIVTGVSTGAMQTIFAAVGDYAALEAQYAISEEAQLVQKGDLFTVKNKGYLYNTDGLRKTVERALCSDGENCPLIEKLASSSTQAFVGIVDGRTGKFRSVSITTIALSAYPKPDSHLKPALTHRQAQQCIAGAVMASSAVPGFMQPVQISHRTYLDGGARYSVYEDHVGQVLKQAEAENSAFVAELFVVRNGPTVVPEPTLAADKQTAQIDEKPDVGQVAKRAYSILVNQSELQSIAGLRLTRPKGTIYFMTADGYRSHGSCLREESEAEQMFPPKFMTCLIRWGHQKAKSSGWLKLCEIGSPQCAPQPALQQSSTKG